MTTPAFFRAKPGKSGPRHFWDPSTALRAAGWQTRRLSDDLAAALAEAAAINAEVTAWRTARPEQDRGTFAALASAYKASRAFRELAAKTRYDYDYNLAILLEWAGPVPVEALTRRAIRGFYEELFDRAPHTANYAMRVLRLLLNFAVECEMLPASPMHRFRMIDPGRVQPILWTDEHVAAFVAAADAKGRHSLATAVALNVWLGQREGDIIRLARSAYRDGSIWLRQRKTGAEVDLPVSEVPALERRLLDELARNTSATTIIASERTGRPYGEDGFRHAFAALRDAVPACAGLRFMWLRHTAVTRLAEAGCSTSYIGAITGHSDQSIERIIKRYRVRTRKMAIGAFRMRMEAEGRVVRLDERRGG